MVQRRFVQKVLHLEARIKLFHQAVCRKEETELSSQEQIGEL